MAFFINAFGTDLLPYITKAAFIWSISGFTIICIALLACASPTYNSGDFVFRLFLNSTGWPDGVAWLLGLLQGGLGLIGYDAVAHVSSSLMSYLSVSKVERLEVSPPLFASHFVFNLQILHDVAYTIS